MGPQLLSGVGGAPLWLMGQLCEEVIPRAALAAFRPSQRRCRRPRVVMGTTTWLAPTCTAAGASAPQPRPTVKRAAYSNTSSNSYALCPNPIPHALPRRIAMVARRRREGRRTLMRRRERKKKKREPMPRLFYYRNCCQTKVTTSSSPLPPTILLSHRLAQRRRQRNPRRGQAMRLSPQQQLPARLPLLYPQQPPLQVPR